MKLADSSMPDKSPWLMTYRTMPAADTRLVVFPHAGGCASFYRPWAELLPPFCELQVIQYPGRESRTGDLMIDTMGALATGAAEALSANPRRTILFGHSMGAAVAYETLRLLKPTQPKVTRLCISARELTPAAPSPSPATPRTDEALLRSMKALGGTPTAVLEDSDLRAMLMDIVRNDYLLLDRYHTILPAQPALDVELLTLAGDQDPEVDPVRVKAWSATTTGAHSHQVFRGGHFYLTSHLPRILELATS